MQARIDVNWLKNAFKKARKASFEKISGLWLASIWILWSATWNALSAVHAGRKDKFTDGKLKTKLRPSWENISLEQILKSILSQKDGPRFLVITEVSYSISWGNYISQFLPFSNLTSIFKISSKCKLGIPDTWKFYCVLGTTYTLNDRNLKSVNWQHGVK